MLAMTCKQYGIDQLLTLTEAEEPAVQANQVKIRVATAGVTYADTLMMQNRHQNKHELPFSPGMEVAGEIVEMGNNVSGLAKGQRVMALVYDGGYAEYAVAEKEDVFSLPDAIDYPSAVAMGSTYLTSHASLRWGAQLAVKETVLILGASGAVGLAAVEISKQIGADIVACASTSDKLALAERYGADHLINYVQEDIKERMAAIKPEGADVVFDPVGGTMFEPSLSSLGWGGRYVIIGFAGGSIPKIPTNRLLVKNRAALGFVLMYYRRKQAEKLQASWKELAEWFISKKIQPHIYQTLSLEQANEAIDRVHSRSVSGKIVLMVNG